MITLLGMAVLCYCEVSAFLFPRSRPHRIPPCRKESGIFDTDTKVLRSTFQRKPTSSVSSTQSVASDNMKKKSIPSSPPARMQDDSLIRQADAIVCGGGPTGLLTAIMLAQQKMPENSVQPRFRNIQLYDRLSVPPNPDDDVLWNTDVAKFYLIGLGGRGQSALRHFQVWDRVRERCVEVVGRKDWAPNGPKEGVETIKGAPVNTQVLPRDRLVGVLYQYIKENYSDQITLNYNVEVQPIDFHFQSGEDDHPEQALIRVAKCTPMRRVNPSSLEEGGVDMDNIVCDTNVEYISTRLLIAADGTIRTIANTIAALDHERVKEIKFNPIARSMAQRRAFFVKRYVDDNQRVYKTIPLKFPKDWRSDLNYSARIGRANLEALPANHLGDYCGVLLLRGTDSLANANSDAKELRQLLDEGMPQFSQLLNDDVVAAVAQKPVSYLPTFRYVGPRLHEGDCTVLLGDCAHTVKPYFGLGANSALEDVKLFGNYLSSHEKISDAIQLFSRHRAPESKTLVRISRDLDRPGKLGFIMFILPIILDSIFHKLAPRLFRPNVITMLQREAFTFQGLARRKRLDRMLQVLILGIGFTSAGLCARFLVNSLAKVVGVRLVSVWAASVLIGATWSQVKRRTKLMQKL
jgi:kynurenine 3-monooxygenase